MSVHGSEIEDKSITARLDPLTPLPSFQPRSIIRAWSLQIKQRKTAGLAHDVVSFDWDYGASRLHRATANLQRAIMGNDPLDAISTQSWVWFQKYLENKITPLLRDKLIVPVVTDVSLDVIGDDTSGKTAIFTLITEVAKCLVNDGEVTLPGIVDHLTEVKLEDSRSEKTQLLLIEGRRELATHLVFHVIGWITAIWEPLLFEVLDSNLAESRLCIAGASCQRRRPGILYHPVVRNPSLSLQGLAHQPLRQTAGRFGKLFPVPELCLEDNTLGTRDIESACITTAYLSYHSLANIVDVKIAWTSTLGQHLEYDQRHKKLFVFKNPSICLLLYRKTSKSILSEVFKPTQQSQSMSKLSGGLEQVEYEDYLAEVLLSYRLVFAHDQRSGKLIGREIDALGPDCDPLLRTLCTEPNTSDKIKEIYNRLDAESCENYVFIAEFPFLAKRFIRLQKASMGRNPHSIRRLWYDRRNPPAWFALWAVLIITGATLLLQFLQLVFQIYTPF
ncbi:hypothetical protein PV10_04031 [Exophiala mesophila]|uniref:Uncharacterized protein n=1 Tax=Exophiala mesophila TaxID=212818 RepID=A0A0D2A107_EXOME|nr:uncharacterized protein PV10_04031 [Exophiala mesophila]KIV92763.1 hypothetical protein PV10_04031 [Exophiala mesophila]